MTTKYSVKKPYKNKDRGELLEFQAELKSIRRRIERKEAVRLFPVTVISCEV